ncbi:MAG: hypothetical protein C207_01076 [Bradyrhizobium sp. DFCI-1]|uniref:hypothetical protein n=1 Tax=Klebsiella pneumoniae TaxID=573 RepID=UPI000397F8D6|nr:MAG: hypothetical protein C207_01076 [Bradyrhizobium sp. DFCI-1]MEE4417450.1 hypothetical protein [Klebsiella pneumoniae]HAQ83368.1 hypothetical protein [Bradyrhizobium sp.]HAR17879.1 hypothetical protein [Bradyrhizobium sp.]HAR28990.1 hypothetical protein [Bradyrhizobium sp.]
MSYTSPASLFDNREALARDGETDVNELTCATASKHLEAAGDAWLAERGFDANANELTPDGVHVASTCLMSQGKRVSEARAAQPRPEFVSEAALHSGARLHDDPEASIDTKRLHRVRLQHYYTGHTKPCADDACRFKRIEDGLQLLTDAQSDFEIDFIVGAIHRDCKILGVATPAELAVILGCSTSTVYTRMKDASLEAAIVAIAAEKHQAVAEARQSRNLKLDVRLATKGTVFDSPAWHREIERLYVSLRFEIMHALTRETTRSRLDFQKGSDRALKMIPQSRLELLDELGVLTPQVCRMLGALSETDRDEWIAQRDADDLAELCGDAHQRRKMAGRYDSKRYAKKIKAYLKANGRNPDGPVLPKPNTPTTPARKGTKRIATKRAA